MEKYETTIDLLDGDMPEATGKMKLATDSFVGTMLLGALTHIESRMIAALSAVDEQALQLVLHELVDARACWAPKVNMFTRMSVADKPPPPRLQVYVSVNSYVDSPTAFTNVWAAHMHNWLLELLTRANYPADAHEVCVDPGHFHAHTYLNNPMAADKQDPARLPVFTLDGLDPRTLDVLHQASILTIDALLSYSEAGLRKVAGMGKTRCRYVVEALARMGLSLS